MTRITCTLALAFVTALTGAAQSPRFDSLFDGKTLNGWKGLDGFWRVEGNAIVGETTADHPTSGNTFLIWQGGDVADFEFRCLVRFQGNNSGVQYRSDIVDESKFVLRGYQADLHSKPENFGMLYGEKTGRGIIANRGLRIRIDQQGKRSATEEIATDEQLVDEQWNELRIIAVGNRLIHQINRVTTCDVTDDHADAARSGKLGFQLHAGPPMKVEFRGVLLRKLGVTEGQALMGSIAKSTKLAGVHDADTAPLKDYLLVGKTPTWIWAKEAKANQRVWFRHEFEVKGEVTAAPLYASCDNHLRLFLNGKSVGKSDEWNRPLETDVRKYLRPGRNVIAIEGRNDGGPGAAIAKLSLVDSDGAVTDIVSDKNWLITETQPKGWQDASFQTEGWIAAMEVDKLGGGPWGTPRAAAGGKAQASRLNPRNFFVPPGFEVDRIHAVEQGQGSWVSLTTDAKGRLFACDQGGAGLYRLTLRDDEPPIVEAVSVDGLAGVSGAQGLLWKDDSLWFHRNGGHLFRLYDSNGDDRLDSQELIPSERGGGEHGNHAVITTEDGEAIYMVGGNHAPLAEQANSRVPTWHEGLLLPRMWDARGHARGKLAPGGWVTRLDPTQKTQTLHSIGYRNQYDVALNRFGDLFTYDADMEWDLGLPWYRPTRICLAASGSDYGWRSGSGKWPTYYEDSLPPVVEIGPGSPTGVVAGTGTHFPTRYQDAIFALDWTFGTIYAIHLQSDGAGYKGEAEPFAFGTPMPVTDATVGHDGNLYFTIGGRGAASGLFRIRYVGSESRAHPTQQEANAAKSRQTRRMLEAFHGVQDQHAVELAWPYLSHEDRFIRSAARVAIESQELSTWRGDVAGEPHPQSRITASVALARMGEETDKDPLLAGLIQLDAGKLTDGQTLGMLRAYALAFIELGRPSKTQRAAIITQLDPLLPSENDDVNTELVRVLTYLQSPSVIAKAMNLIANRKPPVLPEWTELASRNSGYGKAITSMLDNHPPTRAINYAFMLRNLRRGWTLDQRRAYFQFLNDAAKASGGASFTGYLTRIREEALGNCSSEERLALQDLTGEDFNPKPDFPITDPLGPGQKWTVDQAMAAQRGKPNFERGRSLFFSAKCAACHRIAGLGGNIGPDLTSVRNKFDVKYLVEAIVEPSKHISDQYGSSRVLTADGQIYTGLVIEADNGDLTLYPIDENGKEVKLLADDVESIETSKVSQMPEALLDRLNAEEVRDLIGYVLAAGDESDKRYQGR